MSDRGPYWPSLERFVGCVCEVLPMKKVLSINKAAKNCGQHYKASIDPRTVDRYVTQHLYELNKRTDKKCGKKVAGECARKGFEITKSLSQSLRDQRKTPVPEWRPKELSKAEQQGACVAELKSEANRKWQNFLPLSFSSEINFEPRLLSSQAGTYSRFRSNKGSWPRLVV